MISEDEGDVIFRRPPGRGTVLIDSESELDGEISRNSRSASFDQDSGGSEPDDVDLGPGDLSDDGSHSSRQSSSPSPPLTLPTAHLDVDICKIILSRDIEILEKNPSFKGLICLNHTIAALCVCRIELLLGDSRKLQF